jgi:hypothetical protein
MKKLILMTALLFGFQAYTNAAQPDILVYSRTSARWNLFLLSEFRTFMNNLAMGIDPYQYNHPTSIFYSEENISDLLDPGVIRLTSMIQQGSGINILKVKPELVVERFSYTIGVITPLIDPVQKTDGNVVLKTQIGIGGLEAKAQEIKLNFNLDQQINGSSFPALEVSIVNPRVVMNKNARLKVGLDVLLKEEKDYVQLAFDSGDFSQIGQLLARDPHMIDILYDDVIIPEISIDIMGRQLSINRNRIKALVAEQKNAIKLLLLEQVRSFIEKDGAIDLLKEFDGVNIKRDHWILTDDPEIFPVFLGLRKFTVPMSGILRTELAGDFCSIAAWQRYEKDCINNRQTPLPLSNTTALDLKESVTSIENNFKNDRDLQMLISLSEDYINKVIVTTIDEGIWKDITQEIGVEIGPSGVMVQFDKKGGNATVLLDIIYDVGKLPGLILRERYLRFPVILDATIRVENRYASTDSSREDLAEKVPHIVFSIKDVNLDENVLLHGHQEYNFPSTVNKVRKILRKTVIKQIKKELFDYEAPTDPEKFAKWKGIDLPAILLPEIKDMNLDKANVVSDAKGRMNILFRGSETIYRPRTRMHSVSNKQWQTPVQKNRKRQR